MIGIQKIGKSFSGALIYNLKKIYHPDESKRAELLDSNFSSVDSRMIQKELSMVRSLRPNLKRYVYHTSLNFSNDDKLDNEKLLKIAHDYLTQSGYTNNQYLIFRHYDADHPHIHLLVNRITFDGDVVSDSNNYKKSEAILRKLETKYNLITVERTNTLTKERNNPVTQYPDNTLTQERHNLVTPDPYNALTQEHSNTLTQKAITKEELEMINRTGTPSGKVMLQELMTKLLKEQNLTLQHFIQKAEQSGIHFLFNQASTGRVTGITYFYEGFKIKGQSLGNRYKWAELIKTVAYEQSRDSEAISQANDRTTTKYGKQTAENFTAGAQRRSGSGMAYKNPARNSDQYRGSKKAGQHQHATDAETGDENRVVEERSPERGQNTDLSFDNSIDHLHNGFYDSFGIEISDDIDDEDINGRNRHRKRQARTNSR